MRTMPIIFSVLFFSFSAMAQEKDNTLTPEEFAQGWELLFDGETLKGWKAYNGEKPQTWKVDDHSIHCVGTESRSEKGGDDIMTVATFGDFDFKFNWRIEENGNSGVIYRVREGKQWVKPYLTGAEYQVHGGSADNFSNKSIGSLYDVYAPSQARKVNPPMQWNSGRIRISNGLVTHWVNGEIVVQCQLHSDDWNERVANSKWHDDPYYMTTTFGHIDFQNHGYRVWYKNLKILKLD